MQTLSPAVSVIGTYKTCTSITASGGKLKVIDVKSVTDFSIYLIIILRVGMFEDIGPFKRQR